MWIILVSLILAVLPALDYICNKGKVFDLESGKELYEATLNMVVPIANILVLGVVLIRYFKKARKK